MNKLQAKFGLTVSMILGIIGLFMIHAGLGWKGWLNFLFFGLLMTPCYLYWTVVKLPKIRI